MNDWTAGYVADIGYTYGYYAELNPLRIRLAFLNAGLIPPNIGTACELGFGQGMSVNLHAAASVVHWSGTDFNPSQASFAQELTNVSESGAQLFDEAFEEFCNRRDLPEFDYICLHGIWSWISDRNRSVIVDFIRRKLKVGGVLYISYNTQPGWASMAPMRDLLAQHADVLSAEGVAITNRIDAALAYADRLIATNPSYLMANPQVADRIKKIKEQNRHYLAHEYFNRDWHPMAFAQMARCLQSAKLNWACSANYLDAVDSINLTGDQQNLLNSLSDLTFRQTTRDFCVNQMFRKDYWVKGIRNLSSLERVEALRNERIILAQPRADVSLKVTGSAGEASLQAAVYNPILDELSDHKPKTLGQLEQALRANNQGNDSKNAFALTIQAAMLLGADSTVQPVHDDVVISKAKKRTDRLNTYLMNKARSNNDLACLASPVTGGGIAVPRLHQLFLLARQQGRKQRHEWVDSVWNILAMQGQKITKEGQMLETAEDNIAELNSHAQAFEEKHLPVLTALRVV